MNRFILATALTAAVFACDDDDDKTPTGGEGGAGGAVEQSPLEVGCQHFEFGIETARTTTADGSGADAHIAAVHQRYVITFGDVEGSNGQARFTATADGMHYFMLSDDVPFSLGADAGALTPTSTVPGGTECPAANIVHEYMLEAGDYTISFGEAPNAQVVMVVHLDGQAHDHGHGGEGGHAHGGEGGHAHGGEGGHAHGGEGGHAHGGEGGEGGHAHGGEGGEGGHAHGGEGGEGGHAHGGEGGEGGHAHGGEGGEGGHAHGGEGGEGGEDGHAEGGHGGGE